ncbi:MAG: hypothetical protein H0T75_18850 [Rhizobiales bacterium]|nr:hypothetical protein [Hyphomicrobiales bacterium]
MRTIASVGKALAWLLLLPGDLACNAMSVGNADNRDLVRMLINGLVWIVIGVLAVALAV